MLSLPPLNNGYHMSKLLIVPVLATCMAVSAQNQNGFSEVVPLERDSVAMEFAETIRVADLKNYLSILASDALEGRETGSRGQKMAAAFIREHFRDNKLLPVVMEDQRDSVYFQKFPLYKNCHGEVYLEKDGTKYHHLESILYNGNADIPDQQAITLQFVGDGELEDYTGLEAEEKMVAFWADNPEDLRRKVKIAKDQGAASYFIINQITKQDFQQYVEDNSRYFESVSITKQPEKSGGNILFVGNLELVADLLGMELSKLEKQYEKTGKSSKNRYRKLQSTVNVKIEKLEEKFETENVLGFVEGTDKKEELVVITAHYDHVGRKDSLIYNGADDDGSGTAAVMEMAQAFAIAKSNGAGPRRSMLFMTVAGEENGLLGSAYYADHPVWPLSHTVVNLNIDMIGRVDPLHQNKDEYVYIIGSDRLSMDLHAINEQVNKLYTGLELDYKYNAEDDPNRFYFRSDHYNFAKHNIPIIFYFNGTHEDYHQPTDTIDKIRFDLLKKRADLVFYCAWELANRQERVRLNQ